MTRDASKYVGRKADNLLIAFVWMMLSALGFSLMMLFVKELSPEVPQFEMVFFRSFVNCVVAAGLMLLSGESFFPPNKPLLVFRGIAGFGGVTCFFYAISRLPMSIAALLNWISPIFVILFSRLFLGERFSSRAWVWIVTAFIGLVLLLRVDLT